MWCTTSKLGRDSPLCPVHVVQVPESRKSPVEKDKPVAALIASIVHFMMFHDALFQHLSIPFHSQILHCGVPPARALHRRPRRCLFFQRSCLHRRSPKHMATCGVTSVLTRLFFSEALAESDQNLAQRSAKLGIQWHPRR